MSQQIIRPTVGKNTWIAPSAYVGGEVTLGDDCTILYQVVIRGDVSAIRIGNRVNIQDGTIVHTRHTVDLEIDDDVVIGHRAVVHCKRIGRRALIGIGSIVLDNAEIGEGAIVAAGAVVPPNTIVPPGKLVRGIPAKIGREVSTDEKNYVDYVINNYQKLAQHHANGLYPNWADH